MNFVCWPCPLNLRKGLVCGSGGEDRQEALELGFAGQSAVGVRDGLADQPVVHGAQATPGDLFGGQVELRFGLGVEAVRGEPCARRGW